MDNGMPRSSMNKAMTLTNSFLLILHLIHKLMLQHRNCPLKLRYCAWPLLGGADSDKTLINCEIAEQLATMVGQLTRVELNLHQMGLTSLVSAPENLANSGGRHALRSSKSPSK